MELDIAGFVDAYGLAALLGVALALAAGGFVKGVVGFALPLVALSLMGSFLPADVAIGLLIVPTLVSNLFQALRNGVGAALGSLRDYARLNIILIAMIALCAQLVVAWSDSTLFLVLGGSITAFGISQLAGFRPSFRPELKGAVEVVTALVAGFFGGLSGIWGPPLVMYLLAAEVPKVEMVRVQSLSYLLGSFVLVAAHLKSGVLNAVTLPVSVWMVAPVVATMLLGVWVQDRLDQELFRKATLAVLVLAGLNLLRRAFAA